MYHSLDRTVRLLGFRLRPHLLDLLALTLDLLLLPLHLPLGLRAGIFLILHRVADYVTGAATQNTTDRGAGERMAYGRPDKCAATRAQRRAAEGAFFTSRERLPRASCKNECSRQRQTHDYPNAFAHMRISFVNSRDLYKMYGNTLGMLISKFYAPKLR